MSDSTIWTYIIIYGAVFGILSSIAVKKKNRDQAGWFFIGLIFGIFGFIAALVVDKLELPIEQALSNKFDPSIITKKCPDCAETIKLEAKICRFCQHRFSDEEVARQIEGARADHFQMIQSNRSTTLSMSHWDCPRCHRTNRIEQAVCLACGFSRTPSV